jgi:hypothetical protein
MKFRTAAEGVFAFDQKDLGIVTLFDECSIIAAFGLDACNI